MGTNKSESKEWNYAEYDFSSIRDATLRKASDKIIKIRGHVLQLDDALYDNNDKLMSRAIIADGNKKISTTALTKKQYPLLEKYQENGNAIIILGEVVAVPSSRKGSSYVNGIKILDFRPARSALSIIAAKKAERKLVKYFIKTVQNEKFGIFDSIKEAVIAERGIRIKGRKLLERAIEVAVIQAFTYGRVLNTTGKIHTLLIGGSGCGKKLVAIAAGLINIVSESAQAGRITKAGLTADLSGKTVDGTIRLNLIPKVNKGIAVLQDFDKAPNKDELYPIISDVMEDGVCKVTGKENLSMDAETAFHMDLNPKSSQRTSNTFTEGILDDIGMDKYFLSRFDYINYLPQKDGPEIDPIPPKDSKIHRFIEGEEISIERFIKVLVAYVLSNYAKIDTNSIQDFKDKKFNKMKKSYDVDRVFSTYEERMKNSVIKFIEALTRLQLRKKSNKRAVNLAYDYLSDKMKFLEILNQEEEVKTYPKGEQGFVRWVYDTYGAKTFTIKSLIEEYKNTGSLCGFFSKKTIYNWLHKYADSDKHNEWQLKPKVISKLSR
jgi:hypothetical protein